MVSSSAATFVQAAATQTSNLVNIPADSLSVTGFASLAAVLTSALVLIPLLVIKAPSTYGKSLTLSSVAWFTAFAVNWVTVSLPGRFDNSQVTPEGGPWKSLFAPAPWAFAIWGVIYILETFLSCAVLSPFQELVANTLIKVTPFWVAGNLYQSLWCLSFRPIFQSALWLPASLLSLAASSLFIANGIISSELNGLSWNSSVKEAVALAALRLPISLHCGWLAAATLLNLNGWAAYKKTSQSFQLALAFGSVYVAFVVGAGAAVRFRDPFLALTVAWASAALSYQASKKSNVDIAPVALSALSYTEDILSKALVAVAFASPFIHKLF